MSRSPKGTAPLLRFHISTSVTIPVLMVNRIISGKTSIFSMKSRTSLSSYARASPLPASSSLRRGYVTIKFSLSCNAFAPSCAKCTP